MYLMIVDLCVRKKYGEKEIEYADESDFGVVISIVRNSLHVYCTHGVIIQTSKQREKKIHSEWLPAIEIAYKLH